MQINKRTERNIVIVEPIGDMGLYNLGQLRELLRGLRENGSLRVIIEMNKIPGTDSIGIGFLIQETILFTENGGELKLSGISPGVRKSLQITETLSQMDVHHSTAAALDSFSKNS